MHLLKQQNNLINKIWTTKNFQHKASSGSLSFHPVFWLAVLHMHYGLKEYKHNFFLSLNKHCIILTVT